MLTRTTSRRLANMALAAIASLLLLALPAQAWKMTGTKIIKLHGCDGQVVLIGSIEFVPKGDKIAFALTMDPPQLKVYFLSMCDFKCLDGVDETLCHVPCPYDYPAMVCGTDFTWIKHSLLFLFKAPKDFGVKWCNGVNYHLTLTDQGMMGLPQAIDLNEISAPHAD